MLLTAKQVAEKLGLSANTVREMCEDGRLPGVNTAGKDSSRNSWKVDDKALREWRAAQRNGHAQTPSAPPTVDAPPAGYVTYADAAKLAGVTESGISYRVRHGSLQAVKVNGRNYVQAAALRPKQQGHGGAAKQTPTAEPRIGVTDLRTPPSGIMALLQEALDRLDAIGTKVDALHRVWIG
jgi:excisionase family DNA binding protein